MHIDVLLDPFGARWTELRDRASAAADAGFSGIWTWDHVYGGVHGTKDVLECWTVLTAVAVAVPGVVVGPLVLNVANRHPAMLATMAATLQQISGGRLLLGLGAGGGAGTPYVGEQAAIGRVVPPDPVRRAQVESCIAEVRRLWQTPGFLAPDPAPPFVIGGFGPKMAEVAGASATASTPAALHPRLREIVEIARTAYGRTGRDPDRFLVTVFTAFDEQRLEHDVEWRAQLEDLRVDRLILLLGSHQDRESIASAGRVARRLA